MGWSLLGSLRIFLTSLSFYGILYATSVAQRMLRERSLMPPKVKFSKEAIIGRIFTIGGEKRAWLV